MVVGAVVLGLVGPAAPAGAADTPVSGELVIVGWFAPLGTVCTIEPVLGLDLDYDGGGTWVGLGDVTAHVEFCAELASGLPSGFAVTGGSFTFTTDRGTLSGDIVDGYAPNPMRLVFEITAGTGDYVGATGSLVYDAVSFPSTEGFGHRGPITGTVTVPDRPQSVDDCKGDGWRELVDETGQPFANQGRCVSWANLNVESGAAGAAVEGASGSEERPVISTSGTGAA